MPGNTDEQIDSTDSNAQEYSNGKSPIICKPSLEAMQAAIKIANIDPKKTVMRLMMDSSVKHKPQPIWA